MSDAKAVQAELEDAVASESTDSSTVETGKETQAKVSGTDTKGKKAPEAVPYSRFQEVVHARQEAEKVVEAKEVELSERTKALEALAAVVDAKDKDAQYVHKIRELYNSEPDWKPVLEKLARRLDGIEEEVDEGEKTPEKAADETRKLLKQTTEELQDAVAEQRAEIIAERAHALAAQYLNSLPEEYSERDRNRIAHLWTPRVDWEKIETSENWQEILEKELPRSLDEVLNQVYGEPEGLIIQGVREQLGQVTDETTATEETHEQKLAGFLGKEYGKVKEVTAGKGKTFQPEVSDDDFAREAAEAMRAARAVGLAAAAAVRKGK